MKTPLPLLLAVGALIPAGCTLAPKYTRPAAAMPKDLPSGPAYLSAGTTNATVVPDLRWQSFFPDERLRHIIGLALTNNTDLRLAALNVQRARAMYGIQRAELLPVVNGVAAMSRSRTPGDLASSGQAKTSSRYDVNLGAASWEVDFFGRIRSLKESALQEYLATEQARRSAQILLIASTAEAYLALAADRENLRLAETTLKAQQTTYDLIKRRHELGLVSELDVFRAQTPLENARREAALYTQQVAKDENALNLLVGARQTQDWSGAPGDLSGIAPPQELQPGLSSEVLLRRPDVLQAENLLQAANADIGAARAALFPRISLTAAVGTASAELSGLFKSGSGAWSYAPQIVMPVLDARVWAAHRAAKVQYEMAVAQYDKAVQSAFREVADALAVRGTADRQVEAQQALVKASAETFRLATSRYDRGIDSFLSVLDAQRTLFAAQQGLVALRLQQLASQVHLYAVLGGGGEPQRLAQAQPPAATPRP